MTAIMDWPTHESGALSAEVADRLNQGQLVVVPTETVYGIAALATHPEAVARLSALKGRSALKPYALAVGHPDQVAGIVAPLARPAARLRERAWPGPLTLVVPARAEHGGLLEPLDRMPDAVSEMVVQEGFVGLRMPKHRATLEILDRLHAPVVLTSANLSGEPPANSAAEAAAKLAGGVDLIVNGGSSEIGRPSSVVRALGQRLQVLRDGALTSAQIRRLAGEVIVFCCTGNTCRSPLAEVLFQRLLMERWNCGLEELPFRGVTVLSAGLSAYPGEVASEHSRTVARERGARLDEHLSQSLTRAWAEGADRIVVMTRSHRETIERAWPEVASKVTLLAGTKNVDDPFGQSLDRYRLVADQMEPHLRTLAAVVAAEAEAITVETSPA